ncbi:MAG: AAA family ATPase, partial [Saprospiraceae bacterium]|nr:AAA family ATPase [Saprospiraceae bacterium]
AGTGKSTLLQLFRNTTKKKCVVLAPTGIAALNVQGQTIHSFFGFPPRLLNQSEIKRRRFRKLFIELDCIIIDEISMVRADMLDNIDYFLRINREDSNPYGAVQMIFFGDLFQLPPVVRSDVERRMFTQTYKSPYFFSAHVMRQAPVQMIELQEAYRQTSRHFLRILDNVRMSHADYDDLEDLNQRHVPDFEASDFYVTLSARNATVDAINKSRLEALPGPELTYTARTTGSFAPHLFPSEGILKLRLGAQVMFIKNDPQRRFVNGTIGKVVHLDPDEVKVLVDEGGKQDEITLEKMEWEIRKYRAPQNDGDEIKSEVVGTFKQFPIKLAWAITIHKSQGKTFERVIIDMGRGAFEHGQTYVALSRCRTLEGIVLKKPLQPRDIMVDPRIVSYYEDAIR